MLVHLCTGQQEPGDKLAEELTVGRAAGCQVTLDDNYVSQLHARILSVTGPLRGGSGATYGTYLNTRKVSSPVAMKRGDRLKIGSTVMQLTSCRSCG